MKQYTAIAQRIVLILFIVTPFVYIITAYSSSYAILSSDLTYDPMVTTKIYDCNGLLISELFEENRTVAEPGVIPPIVKQAFLAAEDRNFYLHSGFDLSGIARAIAVDLVSGEIRQGGSTITQQLVKQLYAGKKRTLHRKIVEIFLALELEKKYSKDQILDMYLNQIYFGHGAYGVTAAARFFLDKDVRDCNAVEAALLATLPSAPARYSPLVHPRAAYEKSKCILFNMITAGFTPKDEAIAQFNAFWPSYLDSLRTRYPTLGVRMKSADRAPFFTEYVRQQLIRLFDEEAVYRGGLQVYTTLDLRQQAAAEESLSKGIAEQNRMAGAYNRFRIEAVDRNFAVKHFTKTKGDRKDIHTYLSLAKVLRDEIDDELLILAMTTGIQGIQTTIDTYIETYERAVKASRVEGALVAVDPFTGGITAMVGGSDFNQSNQLNRAVQSLRQPGSAFKAFVYGAGIESRRITPATAFYDVPVFFRDSWRIWRPENYGKTYRGKVLVRHAFAASLNVVSVLVVDEIDPGTVARFAARLTQLPLSRFSIDPSISLGTSELSPLEMAQGFAVFANGGYALKPFAIQFVQDKKGTKIYKGEGGLGKRVVSPEVAFIMTSLMRSVVDAGTASGGIRGNAGFYLPAAGKTGTTSNFKDAWFVGFTPNLVAAVWMGCDSQRFTLAGGQSAAVVAAPVWGEFMRRVYAFRPISYFPGQPAGVTTCTVCAKTGLLPVEGCPRITELFLKGTEPKKECNREHDEMMSVFDLVRKKKSDIIEKEKKKSEPQQDETKP